MPKTIGFIKQKESLNAVAIIPPNLSHSLEVDELPPVLYLPDGTKVDADDDPPHNALLNPN